MVGEEGAAAESGCMYVSTCHFSIGRSGREADQIGGVAGTSPLNPPYWTISCPSNRLSTTHLTTTSTSPNRLYRPSSHRHGRIYSTQRTMSQPVRTPLARICRARSGMCVSRRAPIHGGGISGRVAGEGDGAVLGGGAGGGW